MAKVRDKTGVIENVPPEPSSARWLFVHSVKLMEQNGRRTAQVKASEYHPNVEDGMSVFYFCKPWESPKVGEYVTAEVKYIPSIPPNTEVG